MIKKITAVSVLVLSIFLAIPVRCQEQTYVVGAGGTYRPFEYENNNKELEGFDIDLIKAIASASGFRIKLINTPWEGIFSLLAQGERDIVISGITITQKRKESVDFSLPYFPAEQVIVTSKDKGIHSAVDLKNRIVGVVNGSTADVAVSNSLGRNSQYIHRFDNTPLLLQELYEGGIESAVGDIGVVKFYLKMHPNKAFTLISDKNFKQRYFGIAVAKGNTYLKEKINSGLKKIIANGTYVKIYQKWFDTEVPLLPVES